MLTQNQLEELRGIVKDNHSIFIQSFVGKDYLSSIDIERLESIGIKVNTKSFVKESFFLGILSDTIGLINSKEITYNDLKEYIRLGQYIPLTEAERASLEFIENQSLKDIRSLEGRIFNDINQVALNGQREFLKDEIKRGVLNKQTYDEIAREIARKTGDWQRDFTRIVQYISQSAYEEGKAVSIQRNSNRKDPLVYKIAYPNACRHCIRLYHLKGVNSRPLIFKLSTLRANGTNIGRKVDDWKAVVGCVHPYCRCPLYEYNSGEVWDSKVRRFVLEIGQKVKPSKRKKVTVKINGKIFKL